MNIANWKILIMVNSYTGIRLCQVLFPFISHNGSLHLALFHAILQKQLTFTECLTLPDIILTLLYILNHLIIQQCCECCYYIHWINDERH